MSLIYHHSVLVWARIEFWDWNSETLERTLEKGLLWFSPCQHLSTMLPFIHFLLTLLVGRGGEVEKVKLAG